MYKNDSILPYFKFTLTVLLVYLIIIMALPFTALVKEINSLSWAETILILKNRRVINAFKVSIYCALIATLINAIFGTIIAWCLTRYNFFGKKIIDCLIDLPLALPTTITGIALANLYSKNGFIGEYLAKLDISFIFNIKGIIIALVFIGSPYIIRTLQPIMAEIDTQTEEAATTLGASRFQIIKKILLPAIFPGLISGFTLSFARCLGEYGSIIFISDNIPYKSEILPLLIYLNVEQYQYKQASLLAGIMLILAFILISILHFISKKFYGQHKNTY